MHSVPGSDIKRVFYNIFSRIVYLFSISGTNKQYNNTDYSRCVIIRVPKTIILFSARQKGRCEGRQGYKIQGQGGKERSRQRLLQQGRELHSGRKNLRRGDDVRRVPRKVIR